MSNRNNLMKPLTGLILTVVFLYLASRQANLDDLRETLQKLDTSAIAVCLLLLACDFTAKIIRWWCLLRFIQPALPLVNCAWPLLVGFALNNVLPLRAGDIARAFGFQAQLGAPAASTLGTLLVERLFDLFVLLLLFSVGLHFIPSGNIPVAVSRMGQTAVCAALAALLLLILAPNLLRNLFAAALKRLSDSLPQALSQNLTQTLSDLFAALSITQSLPMLFRVTALSLAAWLFEAGIFAVLACAVNDPLDLSETLFVAGTATLSTLIPSSPGYIGTFDYFTLLAVQASGMSRDHATVYALTVHLLLWAPITLVGAIYFLRPNARAWWRRTRKSVA